MGYVLLGMVLVAYGLISLFRDHFFGVIIDIMLIVGSVFNIIKGARQIRVMRTACRMVEENGAIDMTALVETTGLEESEVAPIVTKGRESGRIPADREPCSKRDTEGNPR